MNCLGAMIPVHNFMQIDLADAEISNWIMCEPWKRCLEAA